jgi:hypothetical protein
MSQDRDNEILVLQGRAISMQELATELNDGANRLQSTAVLKQNYLDILGKFSEEIRKVILHANRRAVAADDRNTVQEIMSDTFDEMNEVINKHERTACSDFYADVGALNVSRQISESVSQRATALNDRLQSFMRMQEDPVSAVEGPRSVGDHPEKLRNKRAFSLLDIEEDDDGNKTP